MHPFFRIWAVVVFCMLTHYFGFMAAGCAALAAIGGYMVGIERR